MRIMVAIVCFLLFTSSNQQSISQVVTNFPKRSEVELTAEDIAKFLNRHRGADLNNLLVQSPGLSIYSRIELSDEQVERLNEIHQAGKDAVQERLTKLEKDRIEATGDEEKEELKKAFVKDLEELQQKFLKKIKGVLIPQQLQELQAIAESSLLDNLRNYSVGRADWHIVLATYLELSPAETEALKRAAKEGVKRYEEEMRIARKRAVEEILSEVPEEKLESLKSKLGDRYETWIELLIVK